MPPFLLKPGSAIASNNVTHNNANATHVRATANVGRRAMLATMAAPLLGLLPGNAESATEVTTENSPYIQELLKRSEEKKEERKKERLEAYYKKNFKEYFDFEGGSVAAGKARGLSDSTQKEIMKWLEANKE